MDPPPSEPRAKGPKPEAIAAAAPPLEPPGVLSKFHGFFVAPKIKLSVTPLYPKAGRLVFPKITAPASFNRLTAI